MKRALAAALTALAASGCTAAGSLVPSDVRGRTCSSWGPGWITFVSAQTGQPEGAPQRIREAYYCAGMPVTYITWDGAEHHWSRDPSPDTVFATSSPPPQPH